MTALSADFSCRNAPLDYWFVRLRAGDLSFLADFILRTGTDSAEVRISLWVRGEGRVLHRSGDWKADGAEVVIGGSLFAAERSRGWAGDVGWELYWDAGTARIAPAMPLMNSLHPLDLELISYPRVRIAGEVTVSGEVFPVGDAAGTLTHYWGRRLPDAWRWVSAAGPTSSGPAVEAVLMRSRLWGHRPALVAGYLWTAEDGDRAGSLLVSPVSGVLTAAGTGADFLLTGRGLTGTRRLLCSAAPEDFNDLGEDIHQTLEGRCILLGEDWPFSAVGLEYRALP
ncbi:hypothetical protein AU252_19660 [Pseudarthrobacter sulfonivorans]|uniref:AttH domain-containing protein n=1 Tax=Pseudarthrobacter sulfonivorans TaxID=121292 RepID=A0A0U3QNJ6_9MICC|nr:hypothetical protein [Pseudarthrobacter sulfonivorans]ALV43099.1 hypothetical protein AU252_19660 [Pseudarthrobacter sulfonivorans]